MEESGEWADEETEKLSSDSPDHVTFYKRTKPAELSSPKKTEETFLKAKEQRCTPKKNERQTQAEPVSRSRTKTRSTSPGKCPQAGQHMASIRQCTEYQQDPLRRLKDSFSRQSLDHEKKLCKTFESRQGMVKLRAERIRSGHDQESFKRWTNQCPISANAVRNDADKDSRQRGANEKATEDRNTSKDANNKRESLLTYDNIQSRKGSVALSKEAKVQEDTYFKDVSIKKVASVNSTPETLQSMKGLLSRGPWKVPGSGKILSEAEDFRDSL